MGFIGTSDGPDQPTRRRKHSISAHLQAEINKQKVIKAKQAREERRGNLEMQHQYLIEQIAMHLNLKSKDVEEFIIDSPLYMDLIESFFEKKGNKAIVFSYQEADPPGIESGRPVVSGKKEKMMRVLVSNGSDVPLKGVCMFFMRLANETRVNMKTITDEVFFGCLDVRDMDEPGIVLETVYNCLHDIFLKYLHMNNNWVTIPDAEMAANVRHKFITSINHYADFLAGLSSKTFLLYSFCSWLDLV